jgi:hypothetical protein
MSSFLEIQSKLEQFIKKYYTSKLIKGVILFFSIGLVYLIITLLIEHYLWLTPVGRTFLFWVFITVEALLFIKLITFPLLKLFNLQQGISDVEASKLIGNHFPEVSDKLLNVIQLNQNQRESELLLASIQQKAEELQPVPFKTAINFKANKKYLKYVLVPIVIYVLFSVLGEKDIFYSSYNRVVNYNTAFEPPAPFKFQVKNKSLTTLENKSFLLRIQTTGKYTPENVSIKYNKQTYYLNQTSPDIFEHTFIQPINSISFNLTANQVNSKEYTLNVLKTPSLVGFKMKLDYPNYIGKKPQVIESTGNTTVPQGTLVSWFVETKNTNQVQLKTSEIAYNLIKDKELFRLKKRIYKNLNYTLTTSNAKLKEYENLSFTLSVIRDQYPEINVATQQDSVYYQKTYCLGTVSDDYGLTKLQLVYYPSSDEARKKTVSLALSASNFDQFTYVFPGNLSLISGVSYNYYFEIFDNDALQNFKSSRSSLFSYRKKTQEEIENEQLQKQANTIKSLDRSMENIKEQDQILKELSKAQKESEELNWNDKKKLEQFLMKQQEQEKIMKNFSKELKENLENFQPKNRDNDPFKEQLRERFQENEKLLEKNEKLMEELEKLQDKIQKEELTEKLEQLSKQNKNQEKNLEQLLELTKRYYVTKKAEKLAEEINKLAEEQEKLTNVKDEKNTKEAQERLNNKFKEYTEEKEKLEKENNDLKDPLDIPNDQKEEEKVKEEQKEATDNLKNDNKNAAKQNQKAAAKKMKQMGRKMQMQMQSGQMKTMDEDSEMLRQILDNLVVFSFEQEALMKDFKKTDYGNSLFGRKLIKQNELKQNFEHIDDSLFSLSLRQPMLGVAINSSLTRINFNLDKSLERLAENEMEIGVSSQQYTITGANELAVLLSDILSNMQNQMSSMGQGKGKGKGKGMGEGEGEGQGFQLPDIIKKQESLTKKMAEGLEKEGADGKDSKGKGQGEGQGEGQGGNEGSSENDKRGTKENSNPNKKEGYGNTEDINGKLFEIYKQQQQLREQLQNKISQLGNKANAGALLREMEKIEKQLLDKGFNQETLERMQNLKHELLKLDKATFEQGKESKRESRTNNQQFNNNLTLSPAEIKKYFNTTEILNRESLPLNLEYKQKVQEYFKNKND